MPSTIITTTDADHDRPELEAPPPLRLLGGEAGTPATSADSVSETTTTTEESLSLTSLDNSNKEFKKVSTKLRRVSLLEEVGSPTAAAAATTKTRAQRQRQRPRRTLSVTDVVPSESDEPVIIHYSEGLSKILFNGDLMRDETDRVIQATIQLRTILRGEDAIAAARQFVALGGHAILVMAMKKWQTHPIIQYRLCSCMADFTYHYPNTTKKTKQRSSKQNKQLDIFTALVEMGGMDLVVGAMARYAKVESFQYTCMLAIGNLCSDVVVGRRSKSKIILHNPVAEHFVERLNGIHRICNAMKQFPDHQTIQQTGTWLLEVLCTSGMSKTPEMKEEALDLVTAAVRTHPDNHDLATDARSFMKQVWDIK